MFRLQRFLLDPAATDASGGAPNPTATPSPTPAATDPNKGYEAALAKHGNDAATMAREIYRDNERIRAELATVQGKVPGEGAVVLNKADATRWAEFTKLGSLDDVRKGLEDGKAAIGQVSAFQREKTIGQAASAAGFDPEVLGSLAGPDLPIEGKEETKAGKQVRPAVVVTKSKDDKGTDVETRTDLTKYAETTWPKFLPSLKAATTSATPRVGGTPPARFTPKTGATTPTPTQAEAPVRRRSGF